MYKVTSKLRIFAIALMILGALFTAVGFWAVPSSQAEVQHEMDEDTAAHGGGHVETTDEQLSATGSLEQNDYAVFDTADAQTDSHDSDHAEHLYHQLQNRPWSAVFVASFFFFMIGLASLAFLALQKVSQAGWSPLLFRVMEGVGSYILPGELLCLYFYFFLDCILIIFLYGWRRVLILLVMKIMTLW